MSQKDVFDIIKELGGSATSPEIRSRAKIKYPTSTLFQYVADRLRKLKNWGYVELREGKWYAIKKEYP